LYKGNIKAEIGGMPMLMQNEIAYYAKEANTKAKAD
jgi:hypothetical protein